MYRGANGCKLFESICIHKYIYICIAIYTLANTVYDKPASVYDANYIAANC